MDSLDPDESLGPDEWHHRVLRRPCGRCPGTEIMAPLPLTMKEDVMGSYEMDLGAQLG